MAKRAELPLGSALPQSSFLLNHMKYEKKIILCLPSTQFSHSFRLLHNEQEESHKHGKGTQFSMLMKREHKSLKGLIQQQLMPLGVQKRTQRTKFPD